MEQQVIIELEREDYAFYKQIRDERNGKRDQVNDAGGDWRKYVKGVKDLDVVLEELERKHPEYIEKYFTDSLGSIYR